MYRKIQDGEVQHRKRTSYLKPRVLQPFRIKARWESKPLSSKPHELGVARELWARRESLDMSRYRSND